MNCEIWLTNTLLRKVDFRFNYAPGIGTTPTCCKNNKSWKIILSSTINPVSGLTCRQSRYLRLYLGVHESLSIKLLPATRNSKPFAAVRTSLGEIPDLRSGHIEQEDNLRLLFVDNLIFDRHVEIRKRDVRFVGNRDQTIIVWGAAGIWNGNCNIRCANRGKRRSINVSGIDPRNHSGCNVQKLLARHLQTVVGIEQRGAGWGFLIYLSKNGSIYSVRYSISGRVAQ